MATIPENNVNLTEVTFEGQPSLTWWRDPATGRIQGMAEGLKAVAQAVEVMLSVDRFWWQIYSPAFGMEWDNLIGQDPGYVGAELRRRVQDALSIDARILGLGDFSYTVEGDRLTAAVTVNTVYGALQKNVEVTLD